MSTKSGPRPMGFEDELLPVLIEALTERHESPVVPAPASRRRRRRLAIAVTVVAAAVVMALVVPIVLPGGPGGADPAAAALLHLVALRAARQPTEPFPHAGQYVYTKTESVQTSLYVTGTEAPNFFFVQPLTRESWIGTDGSGRIREMAGPVTFLSDLDQAAWVAAGSPDLGDRGVTDESYPAGGLYYLDTSRLPADPQALRDLIEQRKIVGGPKGDWETFSIVGDLLRETSIPPAVRGALYEVAADLPGVELVGKVADASGRPGVAVAYTHEGIRQEFIFDPKTAEPLGENYVLVEDSTVNVESGGAGAIYGLVGPAGMLAFTATYLASGITNSTEQRP